LIQLFTSRSARRSFLLAGTAAAMLSAAPAFAQDEPASASDNGDETEIVVTAQKRSERLQDVPASVSVLNTENLSKQGIAKFEDYAARIPGLSLTSGRPGLTQVTLRGITTGPAQSAAATSFYVGEAPIGSVNAYTGGSNTTLDLDPTDLAQIEVLKGPQGTLYGANSMGGLIKYVTADPSFTDFSGRVSAGVNTVKAGGIGYAFRGAVNVPVVTDTLAISAVTPASSTSSAARRSARTSTMPTSPAAASSSPPSSASRSGSISRRSRRIPRAAARARSTSPTMPRSPRSTATSRPAASRASPARPRSACSTRR
jgi:outer membrane receptor protein involved in Fe transport